MVNFQDTGVWILKKKIMDPVCPERLDPVKIRLDPKACFLVQEIQGVH